MNTDENDVYSVLIVLEPSDSGAAQLAMKYFEAEDASHSRSFTGAEKVTVIARYASGALQGILSWLKLHESRFSNATVEIGEKRISIKGYSPEEVTALLKSGVVNKALRDIKTK